MDITVLGSTGSIGVNTLDVIRQSAGAFQTFALVAGRNLDVLVSQILEFHPKQAVVADDSVLLDLRARLRASSLSPDLWPELAAGPAARVAAATAPEVDFVMSAIVGVAGLEATYQAILKKKKIGLANKEVLVASGALVMKAVRETGTELIPVDS
jgi:1-deoxy-D-xylulose-5-phosphate reductoisomerase